MHERIESSVNPNLLQFYSLSLPAFFLKLGNECTAPVAPLLPEKLKSSRAKSFMFARR